MTTRPATHAAERGVAADAVLRPGGSAAFGRIVRGRQRALTAPQLNSGVRRLTVGAGEPESQGLGHP
jgi:hypothetical protein